MKPQFCMTSSLYFYRESKPSDNEDDHNIDKVWVKKENEEHTEDVNAKLVKLIKQYMTPYTREFEVVSIDDQYKYND